MFYTPYGYMKTPGCKDLSILYNSEALFFGMGCYLLGAGYRSYSPRLMRFHQADNLSPFGKGGANAYAYCVGDPINGSDPSGHFRFRRKFKTFSGELIPVPGYKFRMFMAKDPTNKKKSILTIHSHGDSGVIIPDASQAPLSARDLFWISYFENISLKNQPIHIIACNSAVRESGSTRSFAEALSRLTNAPVIAYEGITHGRSGVKKDGLYHVDLLEKSSFWDSFKGRRSARNLRRVIEPAAFDIRSGT